MYMCKNYAKDVPVEPLRAVDRADFAAPPADPGVHHLADRGLAGLPQADPELADRTLRCRGTGRQRPPPQRHKHHRAHRDNFTSHTDHNVEVYWSETL